MRPIFMYSLLALLFLGLRLNVAGQEVVLPAGALLHCTMDEPDFSSVAADVGDPVICHLKGAQEFGRVAFPRGSYLQGHLEADREPGHFVGKGYLRLEFDRIGLPNTDIPIPSKVVAFRGYRVDREGDIVGKGHPKRDAVEWLFPPFWPWKLIALPARGPRPALKGESQLTLRLMDDIVLLRSSMLVPGWHYFGEPSSKSLNKATPTPSSGIQRSSVTGLLQPLLAPTISTILPVGSLPRKTDIRSRVTLIVFKSGQTYSAASYRIDGALLKYILASGTAGAADIHDIDWVKTSQLNGKGNDKGEVSTIAQTR